MGKPALLNQKLWGRSLATCVLTSPLGDADCLPWFEKHCSEKGVNAYSLPFRDSCPNPFSHTALAPLQSMKREYEFIVYLSPTFKLALGGPWVENLSRGQTRVELELVLLGKTP